ncbi:hypothetical protein BGZ74_008377 [Mortierella antarctica]|nr:hypothetical protein BGZ74_008377 [Mortierella antarctica]
MTTLRAPAALLNDPYAHEGHGGNNHQRPLQHGLGLHTDQTQQPQQQPSTKALAVTSRVTKGIPPPPLVGTGIVLVNDSALHCFGGRLENRDLTNCHYVLDVETGFWDTIEPAPGDPEINHQINSSKLYSLSLTTDPVNTNSVSLSEALSIPPQPRYFHTLNAYGTSLILFGGMGQMPVLDQDSDNEDSAESRVRMEALDDLHVYDIITQRWQRKHPTRNQHTPKARWAHLATVLDHYLVVIGGTDTAKAYVEDACALDLHTWQWVASIQNIGQCGSYRTVAATGPSAQGSSSTFAPSSPSFPSAEASSPQISSNLSWPSTDSGPIDAMATISMVLSGRISAPSSVSSSESIQSFRGSNKDAKESKESKEVKGRKTSERLMSDELTPAFKAGSEVPCIYLYSNYNFQNLQRDLKIVTPHYTHPSENDTSSTPPSFSILDKTQTLTKTGYELPPGLRFPQGHVYQNQLILTGTLIVSGKPPTLAIYAFNLSQFKWERLSTDTILETGSWNRTLLHPASGTLLIFGHREGDAHADYSNRIQRYDHLMMINLQVYGLYEKPVPSFLSAAQELGSDLLKDPSLNDMHVASMTGVLFEANSTILAARWPEFATLLLSPPYVTPLILSLPVPDDVVPLFLHYLYTGALPQATSVTPGMADYLLIIARRYQLNGLHALVMDVLHQTVSQSPVRIYSSALMAGELGLQARAVDLAITTLPAKPQQVPPSDALPQPPPPLPPVVERRGASLAYDPNGLSRNYSNRVPPPSSRPPIPPGRHHTRTASHHSRDSVSTEGTIVGDSLMMQYTSAKPGIHKPRSIHESDVLYLSSPEPGAVPATRQRKMRSPPVPPSHQPHPMSFMSTSSSGSNFTGPTSPRAPQGAYQAQFSYPSPLSPNYQHNQLSPTPSVQGYISRAGSEGAPSIYSHDGQDDGSSIYSGHHNHQLQQQQEQIDRRAQQAKKRLQMQMQYDMDQQRQQQQLQLQQEQQLLREQQQLREQEILMIEQHRLQQQQFLQKQQRLKQQQMELEAQAAAAAAANNRAGAMMGTLDYHFGGSQSSKSHYAPSQMTVESTVETVSSQKTGSSKASIKSSKSSKSDKDKDKKGILSKMKPPKPKASGAELMKSAGF